MYLHRRPQNMNVNFLPFLALSGTRVALFRERPRLMAPHTPSFLLLQLRRRLSRVDGLLTSLFTRGAPPDNTVPCTGLQFLVQGLPVDIFVVILSVYIAMCGV